MELHKGSSFSSLVGQISKVSRWNTALGIYFPDQIGQSPIPRRLEGVLLKAIGLVSASMNSEIVERVKKPVIDLGPQPNQYIDVGISGPAASIAIPDPDF